MGMFVGVVNKYADGGPGKREKRARMRQTGQRRESEQPRCRVNPLGMFLEVGTMKSRARKSAANIMSPLLGGLIVPLVSRYSDGLRHPKYARVMAATALMLSLEKGVLETMETRW